MRVGEAFPSDWLKASDLKGRPVVVTMDHIKVENIGGSDTKPVLYFRGAEKGLVLNKTNANNIAHMHGDEMDDWPGRKIELYATQVDFQGRSVEAIRVRRPSVQQDSRRDDREDDRDRQEMERKGHPEVPDFDDSIPF